MTLHEFLLKPIPMSLEEYEKILKEKHRLENQITRESNKIFDEEDALEILADEVGSERYNEHLAMKQKAIIKREKAQAKLKILMEKLNKGETKYESN